VPASRSILFVSHNLAMPSHHGGCVYPHALLSALRAAGRRIDYAWLGNPLVGGRRAMRDPLRADYIARGFVLGTRRIGGLRLPATAGGWLGRGVTPPGAGLPGGEHLATAEQRAFVARLIARTRPGLVILDGTPTTTVLDGLAPALRHPLKTAVLTHNLTHRRTELYRAAGLPLDFMPLSPEEEAGLLRRADTIVAIQDREAAEFRALLPGKPVITVPMPSTPDPLPPAQAEPGRCLFVGGYSGHNILAAQQLVRDLWPRIRAARPDAQLVLAGTVGQAVPGDHPGVQVLGPVADLRAEYARACICLVPLPMGTGLKIKLVEAMRYGRPVVTTRAGAEGFADLESGRVAPVADDPAQFATACAALLDDRPAWTSAVTRQLEWVRQNLSESSALRQLAPCLD